jgi:hypothetical protein
VPSRDHEAPLEVLRTAPALVPLLLHEVLGVELPTYTSAEVAEADFTQIVPTEFRADLVVFLRGEPPEHDTRMGVVVEIQRARDEAKRRSWPLYLAALHARIRRPTCLVVVATDDAVARWAAAPILDLAPCCVFRPLVVGPAQVPWITEERALAEPWLAVLSALAHGNEPEGLAVTMAALEALTAMPEHHAIVFHDLIVASLDDAARRALEEAMLTPKYEFKSEFARRYYGAGREEGREEGRLTAAREHLLALVERRLGRLDPALGDRIAAMADVERLSALVVEVGAAADAAAIDRLLRDL